MENENLSRLEQYLRAISEGTGAEGLPVPQSRMEEICLAIIMGDESLCPVPQSRLEAYACACVGAGGGSTPTQEKTITITENGTVEVTPDEGYALSKVTANAQVYDAVDDRFAKWIEEEQSVLYDENITTVRDYAFMCYGAGTGTDKYDSSFLTEVHLPNATSIGERAFNRNNLLTTVDIPKASILKSYAFNSCKVLENLNLPSVIELGGHVFGGCPITSLEFPNLTIAADGAFAVMRSLKTIRLPMITSTAKSLFSSCESLEDVYIPNLSSPIYDSAFYNCILLKKLDCQKATAIRSSAFSGCTILMCLILRKIDKVCALSAISAFSGTPFASDGEGGIILCPESRITDYQNATNWGSLYASGKCLFWALEDYTVDGTITGEIDWDKLNTDREGAFETV